MAEITGKFPDIFVRSQLSHILKISLAVAVLTISVNALCQQSQVRETGAPTLDQTITYMNRSVSPEDGYVTSVNACELYFTRNKPFTFAIPAETYVKSTDQFGIAHYGIKWLEFEEPPRVYRFNLAKIDPTSINSKPVPSVAFVQTHGDNVDELRNPDLDLVTFNTANKEQDIEVGHFEEGAIGSASPVFDKKTALEMLVFESKDRAERFVSAFVHAVRLCGGKGDLFAPTPSEPQVR